MTPTPQTPLDAALNYYDRGLMPIPVHRVTEIRDGRPVCSCASRDSCASPGKHPTMAWSQFQRRRPPREEVAEWWSGDRARYGVGILTGSASGNIFVLDVDIGPGKDGDDSLRALQLAHGDLPETAEVRTGGGGLHLYFRAPPGVAVVRNSASKLGPGLDIRGEGGFVVAPPSFHASGQPYVWSWTNTLAEGIADAPAWLLDLVRAEPAVGPGPRERSASSPPPSSPVGAGSLGVLPPAVEDGREDYMARTVFAVALELTGQHGAWPTTDEIFEIAWPQFLRRVDLSRPGRITRDNAEPEMRAKCAQIAMKAESGGMGALEDVVAAYQDKRREQPRQGAGNRQEEAFGGAREEHSEPPRPPTHFPLVYADEIHAGDAALDFVEGLLVEGGMSVWYGDSNVGKTFALLDVAIHVALGRPWRGREVDQGAVIYCALEGIAGIRNRIAAWLKHYGIKADRQSLPLVVIPSSINMLDAAADVPGLIASIKAAEAVLGRPVKMICLDTLSRALAGGNENSPEDMGALVRSSDLVRQETGAHLAYV
ncbi:MAG: bifunctional DNA primase/polymerase, partial [bacterium]